MAIERQWYIEWSAFGGPNRFVNVFFLSCRFTTKSTEQCPISERARVWRTQKTYTSYSMIWPHDGMQCVPSGWEFPHDGSHAHVQQFLVLNPEYHRTAHYVSTCTLHYGGTGVERVYKEGLVECGSATSDYINASIARSLVKLSGRLLTTEAIRRTCSGPPHKCTLQRYVWVRLPSQGHACLPSLSPVVPVQCECR